MLLLLSRETAERTGALVIAEILGYGLSADGYHETAPHPEGEGAARAICAAMSSSGLTPDDVRYVNGHGTGTPKNDSAESCAVRSALGVTAEKTLLSSTKSMIGHLLGAAGAVEGIVTVLALRDQVAPPTASFTEPDPQCGLDPVAGTGRPMVLDTALSNSFGFAGANATIAFARPGGLGAPAPAVGPDDVVVTGFGVITSAGEGAEALWEAYASGSQQGAPEDGLRLARVEFDPSAAGSPRARRRMDRISQLAVVVCRAALGDAGADDDPDALAATGVVLGTGIGPMESNERFTVPVLASGAQAANPAVFPATVHNSAAGQVSIVLGTRGPTSTLTSGHAAGAAALGVAYDLLHTGRAERLVVPAVEALSPAMLDAYRSIPLFGSAAGRDYTSPRRASRWCWNAGRVRNGAAPRSTPCCAATRPRRTPSASAAGTRPARASSAPCANRCATRDSCPRTSRWSGRMRPVSPQPTVPNRPRCTGFSAPGRCASRRRSGCSASRSAPEPTSARCWPSAPGATARPPARS